MGIIIDLAVLYLGQSNLIRIDNIVVISFCNAG